MENIMKKLGKLFAILAVLVCAVCVFAFAVSASDEGEHPEAFKAVNAEGAITYTDTWETAVRAAVGGTVFLNQHYTATSTLTEVKDPKDSSKYLDIKFDLNGHKLTISAYYGIQLKGYGYTFELVGEGGEIVVDGWNTAGTTIGYAIFAKGDSAEAPITVKVNGTGDGIRISAKWMSASGVFHFEGYANSEITGTIKVTTETTQTKGNGKLFSVGGTGETTHVFDGAHITVEAPTDYRHVSRCDAFIQIGDGAHVTVKNKSNINMKHGRVFTFAGTQGYVGTNGTTANGTVTSVKASVTGISGVTSVTPINKWLDLDGSTITADTQLTRIYGGFYKAGELFDIGYFAVEVRADNCKLFGAVRSISGWNDRKYEGLPVAKLYFTNVDYTTSDNVQYTSPWLTAERINLIWNGGTITLKAGSYSSKNEAIKMTVYSDTVLDEATETKASATLNEYCFGNEALALLQDANPDKTISFTERTVLNVAGNGTKYRGADGNIYATEADATAAGTTATKVTEYTYTYYEQKEATTFKQVSGDAYRYSTVDYELDGKTVSDWFGLGFCGITFANGINSSVNLMYSNNTKTNNNYEIVAKVTFKDWNGAVLQENYYPLDATELPAAYDGTKLAREAADDGAGWCTEWGFGGWDTELVPASESKNYVYTAKRVRILDVQGIKLNLSVYTDFELNVYVPTAYPDWVASAVFARDAAGTEPVRPTKDQTGVNLSNSNEYYKPHEVSILGMSGTYMKYVDRYATADTTITTYYLVVTTTDGDTLVQKIEYGVPFYALAAMKTDDETTMPHVAKALVMNMVNYADQVITLSGKTRDWGGKIYAKLIEVYGDTKDNYLAAYNNLDESSFTSEGLTYQNAAGYVARATMLFTTDTPTFLLEYGPRTISSANGVKTMSYGWNTLGAGVYFNYAGDRGTPGRNYAFAGGTETTLGTLLDGSVMGTKSARVVDKDGAEVVYDFTQNKYFYADGGAEYKGAESDLTVAKMKIDGEEVEVHYYALLDSYRYQQEGDEEGKLKGSTSFSKVYDLLEPITINCHYMYKDGDNVKHVNMAEVTYSLAGYIEATIDLRGENTKSENYEKYAPYVNVAKALYAYASAAKDFVDSTTTN